MERDIPIKEEDNSKKNDEDVGINDNQIDGNDVDVKIKPETDGNLVTIQICSFSIKVSFNCFNK